MEQFARLADENKQKQSKFKDEVSHVIEMISQKKQEALERQLKEAQREIAQLNAQIEEGKELDHRQNKGASHKSVVSFMDSDMQEGEEEKSGSVVNFDENRRPLIQVDFMCSDDSLDGDKPEDDKQEVKAEPEAQSNGECCSKAEVLLVDD